MSTAADPRLTPPDRNVGKRPLALGAFVVLLFAAGLVFGGAGDYDPLFGFEAWRPLGAPVFAAAAGLLLLLLLPRVAHAVAGGLGRVADRVPERVATSLVAIGLLVLFLALPSVRSSGDAESIIFQHGSGEVHPTNPLASWLHIGLGQIPGLDLREALRLLAAISGVAFVLAALGIGRACFPDRGRAAAVAVTLFTAGGVTLFFGTVEVYAPVFAAVGVYLFAGLRAPDRPWPALFLGIAVALHGSALALLPSLLFLANGMSLRPLRFRRVLVAAGWFLLPVVVTIAALFAFSPPGDAGTLGGGMGQGPLLPFVRTTETILHRYVMFGGEHLLGVVNVLFLASPIGLLLVLTGGLRRLDAIDHWLLIAAVCLFGLLFVWNLNYELRRDWEVFAIAGLPLAVLGSRRALRNHSDAAAGIGIALLGLFCLVPLVLDNALNRRARIAQAMNLAGALATIGDDAAAERWQARGLELDRDRIGLLYAAAHGRMVAGDDRGAARTYREILAVDPENPRALSGLGTVLYRSGDRDEGRRVLAEALRADPLMLDVRLNLARIAIRDSQEDRAISLLTRGLILAGINPLADEALTLLAELRRKRGEDEDAEILLGLRRGSAD